MATKNKVAAVEAVEAVEAEPVALTAGQKAAATRAAKATKAPKLKLKSEPEPVVAPEVEAPAKAPKAPKLKLKAGPEPVVEEATEFAEMDDNSAEVYNRKDLSESIRTTLAASGIAVPSSVALAMCSAYEAVIQEMISSGANVSLTGFGQFKVGVRAGGERRNPSTGEQITVPAAYTVSFKVGRKLKDSVQMLGIPPV